MAHYIGLPHNQYHGFHLNEMIVLLEHMIRVTESRYIVAIYG